MKVQALFITTQQPAGAIASATTTCCGAAQTGCHAITKRAHCHSHDYSHDYVDVATLSAIGHLTSQTAKTSKFTEPSQPDLTASVRNAAQTIGSSTTSAERFGYKRPKQETYTISGIKTTTPWKTLPFQAPYVVDDKIALKH